MYFDPNDIGLHKKTWRYSTKINVFFFFSPCFNPLQCGATHYIFGTIGKPSQSRVQACHFAVFWPNEQKYWILNDLFHCESIIILVFQPINAFSSMVNTWIHFFFPRHEEMHIWGINNWSFFLHLAISTNQCFFMWH
jgi:hypothetical protein